MAIYLRKPNLNSLLDLIQSACIYDLGLFHKTFKDETLLKQQCHRARRSFEDLLELSRTYFPNTTEEELINVLLIIQNNKGLVCSFCSTINKPVFYSYEISNKILFIDAGLSLDELNYKKKGSYSFLELKEKFKQIQSQTK